LAGLCMVRRQAAGVADSAGAHSPDRESGRAAYAAVMLLKALKGTFTLAFRDLVSRERAKLE